jgi:putative peptide zinc metalloprotease protein
MDETAGNVKLSERLGGARVGLRPDLEVSRQLFRGRVHYAIRDPITLETHDLALGDYDILVRLRPERTLADVFDLLVEEGKLSRGQEEDFYRFIQFLHESGLLNLPVADGEMLYRRSRERRRAAARIGLASVFFLQVPLLAPDPFLRRMAGLFRAFFSRPAMLGWMLLVGTASVLAIDMWSDLTSGLDRMFSIGNLPALWVSLIAIKALHELGHAGACSVLGGSVPEMGAYLIVFTPCAYVDASASSSFPRKRDRIAVALAGIYVEVLIAALALFGWALSPPGPVRSLLQNIIFLASISTMGFNLNPLMRFDGYYVLSDLLEIPNLRGKANAAALSLVKRLALGTGSEGKDSGAFRPFLAAFGLASWCYRILVVVSICALVSARFLLPGLILSTLYIAGVSGRIAAVFLRFLRSPGAAPVRRRAIASAAVAASLGTAALLLVPLPTPILAPAVVSAEERREVLVERSGIVRSIRAVEGQVVEAGDPIVDLEDLEILEPWMKAEADFERSEIVLNASRAADRVRARREEEVLEFRRRARDAWREEMAKLRIGAPAGGVLVRCIPPRSTGRFMKPGDPVATIASGRVVIESYLVQEAAAEAAPRPGDRIEFRPSAEPSLVLRGTIVRAGPAREDRLEAPELTGDVAGGIPVDRATGATPVPYFKVTAALDGACPVLRHGMTGTLRLAGGSRPAFDRIRRALLRFLDRIGSG